MASLLIVSGPSSGDYYLLRGRVVVGRDDDCPIQIADDAVSRHHLELWPHSGDDTYRARDLGSANGTSLNGRPLAGEAALADGDLLGLGDTELMFSAIDFSDGETAFQHYRRRGESARSTTLR